MIATNRAVWPLRVLLVLLFVALLAAQAFAVPSTLGQMAEDSPDLAHLRVPLLVVSVLWLVCAQVVIVCTWKLLTLVVSDRIFSEASLVWVDAIVWSVATAWLLLLGVFLYLGANLGFDPGLPGLLLVMLVAGAVLGLLIVVMRALLRQATVLRTDMEAVI